MNYELEVVEVKEANARVYHLHLPHYHYMKQHFHHNVELVYLLKGSFIAHVNGIAYHVKKDSLFLINTNVVHYFEMLEDSEMITLLISYELLRSYEPKLDHYYFDIDLSEHTIKKLKEKIVIMDQYRKGNDVYKKIKVQEYLNSIYYILLSNFKKLRTTPLTFSTDQLDKIKNILEYIEHHYSEDLTIERLALEFHYSPAYLCRYFKKMCGISILQYIKTIQLNHAFLDVCQSDKTISLIAQQHGFSDSKSFIKTFKYKYGITPGVYRKEKVNKSL